MSFLAPIYASERSSTIGQSSHADLDLLLRLACTTSQLWPAEDTLRQGSFTFTVNAETFQQ